MEEQRYLFEILKSRISKRQRLSDVVEELLSLSADSAYRRIRGETELSLSELKKICDKFNLSMDEILSYKSRQGVLFRYIPINLCDQESYISHLQRLLSILDALKPESDKEIIFTARSIPFYHLVMCPELAYFNLYACNNSLNGIKIPYDVFCNNLDKEKIISMYQQIHRAFMSIPSKEIWTVQTIGVTLRLLEYYFEIGAFGSEDTILTLLNQLSELMDKVYQYANDGYKEVKHKTPFFMYNCSVDLDNNCMMVRKGDHLSFNIILHMLHFMVTDNEVLCKATLKWENSLISKSSPISGESSLKQRYRFFESAKNKINELGDKVKLS